MSRAAERFRGELIAFLGTTTWAEIEANTLLRFLTVVARNGKSKDIKPATYYRRTTAFRHAGFAPITTPEALARLGEVAGNRSEQGLLNLVWVLNADKSRSADGVRKRWGDLVDAAHSLASSPA
jgi:hypothetical protein